MVQGQVCFTNGKWNYPKKGYKKNWRSHQLFKMAKQQTSLVPLKLYILQLLGMLNSQLVLISLSSLLPPIAISPEFLSLKASTGLWPASNYGKDIIIGVIDSGIWPEHPSFEDHGRPAGKVSSKWKGKCGGQQFNSSVCNSKLIGVRYFNAALKRRFRSSIVDSARDTTGHGTYVSSVAAGNFLKWVSFDGYAEGTTKAIADGVDVICIAMGYNLQASNRKAINGTYRKSFILCH
nr:subtilisin-like protease sbt1.9 [Quercus suber]